MKVGSKVIQSSKVIQLFSASLRCLLTSSLVFFLCLLDKAFFLSNGLLHINLSRLCVITSQTSLECQNPQVFPDVGVCYLTSAGQYLALQMIHI